MRTMSRCLASTVLVPAVCACVDVGLADVLSADTAVAGLPARAARSDTRAPELRPVAYASGRAGAQDGGSVVAWYRKAAEQGQAWAQYHLGVMYEYGQGVPKDHVEAHMWMSLAATRAKGKDRERYVDGARALAYWMTPEQLAESRKRAEAWTAAFVLRQKR